eukprot:tig00000042_g15669.t1
MPLESNSFGEKVFPVAEALDEAGWMASCINCGFGAATLLVLPCPSERLDDMEPLAGEDDNDGEDEATGRSALDRYIGKAKFLDELRRSTSEDGKGLGEEFREISKALNSGLAVRCALCVAEETGKAGSSDAPDGYVKCKYCPEPHDVDVRTLQPSERLEAFLWARRLTSKRRENDVRESIKKVEEAEKKTKFVRAFTGFCFNARSEVRRERPRTSLAKKGNNNAKESSAALEADKAKPPPKDKGKGAAEANNAEAQKDTPATGRGLRTQEQRKQPDRLKMDEQLPRGKTSKSKKRSGPGDEATGDESGGSPPPKRGRAPGKEHPRSADSGDEEGAGVASADLGPPELGDDSVLDGTDKSEERRRALLDDARLHKVLKSAYTQPAPGSGGSGASSAKKKTKKKSGDGSQGAEAGAEGGGPAHEELQKCTDDLRSGGDIAEVGARIDGAVLQALEASFAKAEDQRVQACFLVSAGILHLCESRAKGSTYNRRTDTRGKGFAAFQWPNVEKEVEDKFGAVMRAGHFPVNQRTFKVFLNVGALVREFRGYANVVGPARALELFRALGAVAKATDDELRALHEKLGADVPENLFPV